MQSKGAGAFVHRMIAVHTQALDVTSGTIKKKEDVNQNHSEISLHTYSDGSDQWEAIASIDESVETLEPSSCIQLMGTGNATTLWKAACQIFNTILPCDPAISLIGICSREIKAYAYRIDTLKLRAEAAIMAQIEATPMFMIQRITEQNVAHHSYCTLQR